MRKDGRKADEFRAISIIPNYIESTPGSVLIEQGKTRIVCTATVETKIPPFLKDSKQGWITAEYSMLPGSTGKQRVQRERMRSNNRHIEIQRFLSRALRTTINLKTIEDKTIYIDTDVIQADGSTRCTSINGGVICLAKALKYLVYENIIKEMPAFEMISAVSLGIIDGELLLDLNYEEDAAAEADINIVSSESGKVIEIEAFCEKYPLAEKLFHQAIQLGVQKNLEIISILHKYV